MATGKTIAQENASVKWGYRFAFIIRFGGSPYASQHPANCCNNRWNHHRIRIDHPLLLLKQNNDQVRIINPISKRRPDAGRKETIAGKNCNCFITLPWFFSRPEKLTVSKIRFSDPLPQKNVNPRIKSMVSAWTSWSKPCQSQKIVFYKNPNWWNISKNKWPAAIRMSATNEEKRG